MGPEGWEWAGGDVSHAGSLLGITEIAVAQEHLLPRFEGRHPKVGAAGTAESIAQVALLREETIIQGSPVSAYPRDMARPLFSLYSHSGLKEMAGCIWVQL